MRIPYSWFSSISYFLITTFLSLKPRLRIYINRNNKLQIYLKHRNRACSKVRSTTLLHLPLPSFLMNIQAKIINKTVSSRIQDHIRNIIQYNQVGFIPERQGWFNIWKSVHVIHHINKLKEKRSHDHLIRCWKKVFEKSQYPFMIKFLDISGI